MYDEELFLGIQSCWLEFFKQESNKNYFKKLIKNIVYEYKNYTCYPQKQNIFKIFKILSLNDIKVIIFGQDPYHNENQADGIAFSCANNILPPSLKNIFKELKNDLNIEKTDGNLISWVSQGVFLYNSFLTVRKNKPGSHHDIGWKEFTSNLINYIEKKCNQKIIYVLWGNKAKYYQKYILKNKHIISSAHPSPFSYYRGFMNSKPFSKINDILKYNNISQVYW